MEFFIGLFFTLPALLIVILLIVISEHYESRTFALILTALSAWQLSVYFSLSWTTVALGACAYIPIGVLFSFWRYKRYASAVVRKAMYVSDQFHKDALLKKLHPSAMVSTIVTWILIWPFSVMSSLVADIISAIESLVTRGLKSVYNKLYDSAMKDFEKRRKEIHSTENDK